MRRAVGICAIAIAIPAMAEALTGVIPDSNAPEPLIPLSADPKSDVPAYVQTRCRDFVMTTSAVGSVLRSNPVTGRDEKRGDALRWALQVDMNKSFPLALPMQETSFMQAYLDAFGGIQVHEPEPTATIYAKDKAFCAPLLKFYE